MPARQDLTAARGRLVTATVDSRQALSVNFYGLHYWVFKGGWHEHYHGCHRQIHQVFDMFVADPMVCAAEVAAKLFYRNVVKYFGVSFDIISDRDVRFTGRFWTTLFNMMWTKLKFSTTNH